MAVLKIDIQLQLGPTVTWLLVLLLGLPWVELKYFSTNRRSKYGQLEMLEPKNLIVKNSEFRNNTRTSLKKWIFSSTFPVPKKTPEQFKKFKEFQNHWAPWNYMYGITCIPQLFFIPPQLGSPSYFGNFPTLPPLP